MQWNIWYKEDIWHIGELLLSHKADIICLQELSYNNANQDIEDTPAYIAEVLGYAYYAEKVPLESTDGNALILANGIFSRYPIRQKRLVWTNEPSSGGGYDDEYRAYVEVELDIDGVSLTIATTHMAYTHRFEPTPSKRRETDNLMREIVKHSHGYILTGDFNAAPGSYTIDAISDVLCSAGPALSEPTWTTKPFSYNGFDETELRWRLDHIFTTPDIALEYTEIIDTPYSDHLPIISKLSLSG